MGTDIPSEASVPKNPPKQRDVTSIKASMSFSFYPLVFFANVLKLPAINLRAIRFVIAGAKLRKKEVCRDTPEKKKNPAVKATQTATASPQW